MNERSTLEAAVERILYPVIKLLIDCGVTQNHFASIARRTFVKVASQKLEKEVDEQRDSAVEAMSLRLKDAGKSEEEIVSLVEEIDRLGGLKATLKKGLKNTLSPEEIDAAYEELPAIGRVTSTRIAMLTGVPRKDIPELLKETIDDVADDQWYRHRCGKVLADWWRTAEFTDNKGHPVTLLETEAAAKLAGESVSFESLVRRGGKDLSHHALLDELVATECARREEDGRIVVLKRRYEREGLSPESLTEAADRLYSLAETLNAKVRGGNTEVLEGAVFTLQADERKMAVLLNRLRKMTASFLNSAQGTIKQNESKTGEEGPGYRIGVGAYVFKGDEMAESEMFATSSSDNRKVSNE
jgi:hypothetical protein